jgi:hypothetical protein
MVERETFDDEAQARYMAGGYDNIEMPPDEYANYARTANSIVKVATGIDKLDDETDVKRYESMSHLVNLKIAIQVRLAKSDRGNKLVNYQDEYVRSLKDFINSPSSGDPVTGDVPAISSVVSQRRSAQMNQDIDYKYDNFGSSREQVI